MDKDKVIFSWATNTTYVVSAAGRVLLLHSYINRPELPTAPLDKRRTPILPQDFIDVGPEAIFLGHGHGDHADNAAYVAKWTGAAIYASPETCDVMQQDVTRMWSDPNLHNSRGQDHSERRSGELCRSGAAKFAAGRIHGHAGQSDRRHDDGPENHPVRPQHLHHDLQARPLGNGACRSVFPTCGVFQSRRSALCGRRHQQPTVTTYPAMFPTGTPFTPPASATLRVPGQINTTTTGFGGSAGIIEIFYHFVVRGEGRNFTFSFVNSAGPVKEGIGTGSPGLISLAQYNDPVNNGPAIALAAEIGKGLFSIMDNLPHPDVLLGSIVSLGAANNQQRDIIQYIQHLKPKVYYPGHLTDVAQAGSALYHKLSWRDTAYGMGFPQSEWPEFRLQVDPNDFLVPQVFNPGDDRWSKTRKAEDQIRSQCR